MLCSSQAAAFCSALCANDYIPASYRLIGTVEAGLKICRFGQSSSLPSSRTSVGDECGSTAHLLSESHRPHLGCIHHPQLAPSPGEGIVQSGRAHECTRLLVEPRRYIPELAG